MPKIEKPDAPTRYSTAAMAADVIAGLRVVDAKTGEVLGGVIEADAEAGTVSRYEIVDGNLVRENDAYVVNDEKRAIRIEWIESADPAGSAI